MERLSFMDQALHKASTSGLSLMNMQGASVFDPKTSPFKVDAKILAEHIAERLQGETILRKRLVQDPLMLGDVWMVDDPEFDIWNHITFATLQPPGDLKSLTRHLGRFSVRGLDMNRPLWQFEIIDGLSGGRLAVAQKLSHATMDGIAASRVMQCVYDTSQKRPSRYKPRSWRADPLPTKSQLLVSAVRETADRFVVKSPRVAAKLLGLGARSMASAAARRLRGDHETNDQRAEVKMPKSHPSSLTGNISQDQRNIAFAVFKLDQLKALSSSLQCTLNDLCLLMVSEAMLAYFHGVGEKTDFDFVCAMPLSMRSSSTREFGNELSVAMVNLHTTISDLEARLRAIRTETTLAKDSLRGNNKIDLSIVSDLVSILPPLTLDVLFYTLKSVPWDKLPLPVSTVFTNVPGPAGDIYLAGMPVEAPIPIIPIVPPGAISIGGVSNGNNFSFGFHACGKLVKEDNMQFFVDGLESAYRRLIHRYRPVQPKARSKRKSKPKMTTKPKPKPRTRSGSARKKKPKAAIPK